MALDKSQILTLSSPIGIEEVHKSGQICSPHLNKKTNIESQVLYVNMVIRHPNTCLIHLNVFLFALLYLRSDSTIVPLADAKLSGPRDVFEKKVVK